MMNELLNRLDKNERMLVVLREIEGLTYKDISEALDMNIGTVKTNIYRVRDKLRRIYSEFTNNIGGVKNEV